MREIFIIAEHRLSGLIFDLRRFSLGNPSFRVLDSLCFLRRHAKTAYELLFEHS